MQEKAKERWMELCETAATEQDYEKLLKLVKEIDRLLDEKEQRIKPQGRQEESSTALRGSRS
jgi:hypothetical protein